MSEQWGYCWLLTNSISRWDKIRMCNRDALRAVTAFSANANAIKASLCKSGALVLISLVGIFVQPTWPSDWNSSLMYSDKTCSCLCVSGCFWQRLCCGIRCSTDIGCFTYPLPFQTELNIMMQCKHMWCNLRPCIRTKGLFTLCCGFVAMVLHRDVTIQVLSFQIKS